MRLLPGRWPAALAVSGFGVVLGLLFLKTGVIQGISLALLFGVFGAVVSLSYHSSNDTRLLRLLELLPQTIVVNANPDANTSRMLSRLEWSESTSRWSSIISVAFDGDSISFWAGSRKPVLLVRIPWDSIDELRIGSDARGVGQQPDHPQIALVVRDDDRGIVLQFSVLALPGEETRIHRSRSDYADRRGHELLIHYAKARRHGAMPPQPARSTVRPPVRVRNMVVPLAVGSGILIAFGVVVFIGLTGGFGG